MPQRRVWSERADAVIRTMRADGQTWGAIGCTLGLSRSTVVERGRRLRAAAPPRVMAVPAAKSFEDDPNRGALPAGHPLTWGLLTDAEFPSDFGGAREIRQGGVSCGRLPLEKLTI